MYLVYIRYWYIDTRERRGNLSRPSFFCILSRRERQWLLRKEDPCSGSPSRRALHMWCERSERREDPLAGGPNYPVWKTLRARLASICSFVNLRSIIDIQVSLVYTTTCSKRGKSFILLLDGERIFPRRGLHFR